METKEYIVSLNKGVDYDQFWNEIENEFPNDGFMPERRVEILNNRDVSLRQCHYALTDEEADQLRQDPRIYSVEQPTKFEALPSALQSGNFTKTTSDSGDFVNWGLRRSISATNVYGTGSSAQGSYSYCLDGSGVDVVIQDTGIQADHPEFVDDSGNSRVQQIDWFAESGVTGTLAVDHYTDTGGHGTHVAGIVAGKTYGWAKNSRIYAVKIFDSGALSTEDGTAFDVIIGWHNNKPVDPVTGVKRPTIVNMSWGFGDYFLNINGGEYRGTPWTGSSKNTNYGMTGSFNGLYYRHPVRVGYIDVSIQEMIDAGIHVCIAAGNEYTKADVPAGDDYNNYYVGGYFNGATPNYYNRGSSPFDDQAVIVGSLNTSTYSADLECKSSFSNSGPAVDIWAPGSNVMSSCSNTNNIGGTSYYFNPSYNQANISGTSMASPQVCGVGALLLQLNPAYTPAQLKEKLLKTSTDVLYSTDLDNDYADIQSIHGGFKRVLYMPFNSNIGFSINNGSVSGI